MGSGPVGVAGAAYGWAMTERHDDPTTRLDALARAGDDFAARVALIGDRWDAATGCDGWTVAGLVDHVIGGSRMATAVLGGASRDEGIAAAGLPIGPDRPAELRAALADQAAAFAAVDLAAIEVHHPRLDMSGDQLLGFRTVDLAVHAWDLARALGADESLDALAVETAWEFLQPVAPIIGSVGVFGSGPSGEVPDDAPLARRLIDLTGRRP